MRFKGLYKYRDSKIWWFRYRDPTSGKRKFVSLGTADEGDAIHRAENILCGNFVAAQADEIDREIDNYLIDAQEREKNPMSSDSAKTARLGDRVDVVEKSYGYLAPNTGEVNKVA